MTRREHPLYKLWKDMKYRCYNVNGTGYHRYGGRGITVCESWRNDFWSFANDIERVIGERPSPKHSLDRKNNDGNYEPNNVRWATPIEQNRNTRNNVFITAFGSRLTVSHWAKLIGMNPQSLHNRLFVSKWSPEKALTKPLRGRK